MDKKIKRTNPSLEKYSLSSELILNTLTDTILVIDKELKIQYLNLAAQHFFGSSAALLLDKRLDTLLPKDNPIFNLVSQTITYRSLYNIPDRMYVSIVGRTRM